MRRVAGEGTPLVRGRSGVRNTAAAPAFPAEILAEARKHHIGYWCKDERTQAEQSRARGGNLGENVPALYRRGAETGNQWVAGRLATRFNLRVRDERWNFEPEHNPAQGR